MYKHTNGESGKRPGRTTPKDGYGSGMIVSASYRTDIPAYYAAWFLNRLRAGFCRVASPWGGPDIEVSLTPAAVDGFVLWTRNIRPLADALDRVAAVAPFMVQYTITGYPRALEAATPPAEQAVAAALALAARHGPSAVVWRYDPILISAATPAGWHRDNFARLAAALAGATDEVVISFAHIYRKTRRNLDRAAARHGFAWRDPPDDEKRALLADLVARADARGMRVRVCAQAACLVPGAALARCVDAGRLSAVAGRAIAARVKGNRPDCLCHESRDIGAYDSCPQGCAYCYAVSDAERAMARRQAHDADGPYLHPPPGRSADRAAM